MCDDTLVGYPRAALDQYKAIKAEYGKLINIGVQEISPVLKFTGVQIVRDRERRTIMIHQRRYIEQMVSEYASEIKDQESPHGVSKIDRTAFDQMEPGKEGDPHLFDRGRYLRLMGKLVWPSVP